jgi:hypothetical protein
MTFTGKNVHIQGVVSLRVKIDGDGGGSTLLRNVSKISPDYMISRSRREIPALCGHRQTVSESKYAIISQFRSFQERKHEM